MAHDHPCVAGGYEDVVFGTCFCEECLPDNLFGEPHEGNGGHKSTREPASAVGEPKLVALLADLTSSPQTGQRRIRLIVIGTIADVTNQIYRLRHCGLEVDRWSPPQPIPETNEVVQVYIRNSDRLA